MIKIVPAIDLMGGRCVRLTQGDYAQKKTYDGNPADIAKSFADCGVKRLHLVDLDGAKVSRPCNLRTLEAISAAVDCELEWGGGISDTMALESVFSAGATHAIIGSVAALRPEGFSGWLQRFGKKMILGADVKDGLVAVKGWQSLTSLSLEELVKRFPELSEVIVTDVSRDGMLQGPSTEIYLELKRNFPDLKVCVSGGISSMEDIRRLDGMSLDSVITGKAVYEGRITLKDIETWSQSE